MTPILKSCQLLLLIFLCLIVSCGSKSSSNPLNILGTWNQKCTTDDEGESTDGTMEFRDDGTVHYVDHSYKI